MRPSTGKPTSREDSIGQENWSLSDCLRVLRRRKATLLWVTFLGVLVTVLVSAAHPHVYQSRALLEVQSYNDDFLEMRDVYPMSVSTGDLAAYIQTQTELLRQSDVTEQIARRFHLDARAEFQPPESFAEKVRQEFRIVPLRNSRIIQVICDARDAKLAADMANTLAQALIDESSETRQRSARQTYETLRAQLEELKPALAGQPDEKRQVYDAMLQKANHARLASALRQTNLRLIGQAKTPVFPYKPNFPLNLMIGMLGSVVVAIGSVMLREQNASVLHAPGDAGKYLALPELGAIPNDGAWKPRALGFLHSNNAQLRIERAVWEQGSSSLSESFRTTLASILASPHDGGHPHHLVFTSSHALEGKTTVVSNLGFALAETGSRVLLIDGDMGRPQLHRVFEQANSWGLSDVLREWNSIEELPLKVLVRKTAVPNLYLMPGGAAPNDMSGKEGATRISKLLTRFREEFDYVLVDAPSCLKSVSASNMARSADGLVLVVRARHTERKAARAAVKRLESDGVRVMGVILNGWDPSQSEGNSYAFASCLPSAPLAVVRRSGKPTL